MQIEMRLRLIVIPAHAGVEGKSVLFPRIPAFAGTTIQAYAIVR
jgi:hypothetical protein